MVDVDVELAPLQQQQPLRSGSPSTRSMQRRLVLDSLWSSVSAADTVERKMNSRPKWPYLVAALSSSPIGIAGPLEENNAQIVM